MTLHETKTAELEQALDRVEELLRWFDDDEAVASFGLCRGSLKAIMHDSHLSEHFHFRLGDHA